jgi:thymidylate synthase
MLSKEHMTPETIDKVCTMGVGFHIRNSELYMSVQMRSSDQIFGLGTDIPTFSFLYRLVLAVLKDHYDIYPGSISITAMSSHIYERHFPMVERIIEDGVDNFEAVEMPWFPSSAAALRIIASRGKIETPKSIMEEWLIS